MKKKIGLVGFNNKTQNELRRRYKNFTFYDISNKNFFSKKSYDLEALIILFEYPIKEKIKLFFKKKYINFKKLKWVHLSRAGVDQFSSEIKNYNFKITCGKKIQAQNVAEHSLGLLLSITRRLSNLRGNLKPIEIFDKKTLIVGAGGIGCQIAKMLNPFGTSISFVVRNLNRKKISYIKKYFLIKDLRKIILNFDIVINTLPLTEKTKEIFDKKVFKSMKKKTIFICVSRSQTINKKDLMSFVKKNKFFGVGIDDTGNFYNEKNISFYKKNNIIITKHQAGQTDNTSRREELSLSNIERFFKNKKLKNLVSKKFQY